MVSVMNVPAPGTNAKVTWRQQTKNAMPAEDRPGGSNLYERDNQERRAAQLADATMAHLAGLKAPAFDEASWADQHRLAAKTLQGASEATWELLADKAGITAPSRTTQRLTVQRLNKRARLADTLSTTLLAHRA